MAENTGVTSTEKPAEISSGGKAGSFFKKNKPLVLIGGGAAALLLLGHKGSTASAASGTDPAAQLQAQSDYLAQQAADQSLAGANFPGGVAPTTIDTGGGGGGGGTPNLTTGTTPSDVANSSGAPVVDNTAGASSDASASLEGADVSLDAAEVSKAAPANEAPKHNKPKPAKKGGKVSHPSKGARVQGHTGQTVHGRHFPGARGHSVGAPRRQGGNIVQDVTVNFGGHTETHTSVNNGQQWIDNTRGKNPPSRGPSHTIRPTNHPPAHHGPSHTIRPTNHPPAHHTESHPAPRRAPARKR